MLSTSNLTNLMKYTIHNLILSLPLALALALPSLAQQISTPRFTQSGKQILIYYDLSGTAGKTYEIQVFLSQDGGSTFTGPLQKVSGAVGKNISPGTGKTITWDVLAERDKLEGEVLFEIRLAASQTSVSTVYNPKTGKTWMDRNLGASRVAAGSTDSEAYGDLYQWGRGSDGHEKRNSPTTSTLSSSNSPGHGNFILAPSSPYNWRSPQNDNLWQGASGTNNPCPTGFRLPTAAEWEAERQSWSSNNETGAFVSPLKLPRAGYRDDSSGSLFDVGSYGFYWSATVDGIYSQYLYFFSAGADMYSSYRAYGISVRCLKDF
jgi:hypothetical protein